MELPKKPITHLIFFMLLIFISEIKPAHGVCCLKSGMVHFSCPNSPEDIYYICRDGTPTMLFGFCGYGSCNMFGCNCDGGCRTNPSDTHEEAVSLFAERTGCTVLRHQQYSL